MSGTIVPGLHTSLVESRSVEAVPVLHYERLVGNNLPPVTGTIEVTALIPVSGTIQSKRTGPRFPRPHLQPLEIQKRR